MFTTGIFTTHIPYLAFVCMYVIILIGGQGRINVKVPAGEQKVIKICNFSQNYNSTEQFNVEQWQLNDYPYLRLPSVIHCPDQIKKRTVSALNFFLQEMDGYGIFCRPPPENSARVI